MQRRTFIGFIFCEERDGKYPINPTEKKQIEVIVEKISKTIPELEYKTTNWFDNSKQLSFEMAFSDKWTEEEINNKSFQFINFFLNKINSQSPLKIKVAFWNISIW